MKKYSEYKNGQKLIVNSTIDGFYASDVVVVSNNEKKKRGTYYVILVECARYDKPRYVRTDYLKPVK